MSANHFKPWTPEDDSRILDDPAINNATLAAELFRSEHAIRCRRAHLAVRMHQKHPEIRLEECCDMLWAEPKRAKEYLDEIHSRDTSMDKFLKNRKRPREEGPEDEDEPEDERALDPPADLYKHARPVAKRASNLKGYKKTPEPPPPFELTIEQVCAGIRAEEGRLTSLWQEDDYLPMLIRHYPGFRAYAESVRGA